MTRDEILAMPAGWEMDARVSDAVFGEGYEGHTYPGMTDWSHYAGPNYSVSDAAALDLLKELVKRTPIRIEISTTGVYVENVIAIGALHPYEQTDSTSIAMGVCRFALLATSKEES